MSATIELAPGLMSKLKLFTSTGPPSGRARRTRTALCLAATITLSLVFVASASSAGDAGKSESSFLVPCFHKKTGLYTAEVRPSTCDIAGHRNRKAFVEVPITGIRWSRWGSFRTFGSHGKTMTTAFFENDRHDGAGVRVIAYRRGSCGEGRTSYSWVNVVFPQRGIVVGIKLPPCNAASVSG
jgi:hypothetical protein